MSDLAAHIRALAETGTQRKWQLDGPWHWEGAEVDMITAGEDRAATFVCPPPSHADVHLNDANVRKATSAVNALPALADLVEAVTLRHWPQDGRDCAECGDEWPCPTAAALDALAAALGVA